MGKDLPVYALLAFGISPPCSDTVNGLLSLDSAGSHSLVSLEMVFAVKNYENVFRSAGGGRLKGTADACG